MKILNLSNHKLTEKQIEELKSVKGFDEIIELDDEDKRIWGQLNPHNYSDEVKRIMSKYEVNSYHLAGFAPAVVYGVVLADKNGKSALYAYSERKVVESVNEDGSISKNAVFEHKGFFYY